MWKSLYVCTHVTIDDSKDEFERSDSYVGVGGYLVLNSAGVKF